MYTTELALRAIVTDGATDHDRLLINIDEPIELFFGKICKDRCKQLVHIGNFSEDGKSISINVDGNLDISFLRTVRLPETPKSYPLPAGLGYFPLYKVEDFVTSLPSDIVEKGGVFFPMYRKYL